MVRFKTILIFMVNTVKLSFIVYSKLFILFNVSILFKYLNNFVSILQVFFTYRINAKNYMSACIFKLSKILFLILYGITKNL